MTSWSVDLSRGITESFFKDLKNFAGSHLRLRKRVTEITIELFQNISKHAINIDHSKLFLQQESESCSIVAVNTITTDEVKCLQDKIYYINTLDHTQLKRQHTKILANTTLCKKSGAGLGFYRIALRSASNMIPAFKQIDQHYFVFSLTITLTV